MSFSMHCELRIRSSVIVLVIYVLIAVLYGS